MKKRITFTIIIVIIAYFMSVIMPYRKQPQVTPATVRRYNEDNIITNSERACIIDDNGEALAERIRLISQAQDSVVLSTYEFRVDESGKDVLSALLSAAKRGVKVQVIVDGVAALTKMMNNHYFIALSSLEDAEIKIYNPISLLHPSHLMTRMHDKYLMVDQKTYILGGRNTYDYFLGDHDGYKNYDWDVLVYQQKKVQGNSVQQLSNYFHKIWNSQFVEFYHDDSSEQYHKKVIKADQELTKRYQNIRKEKPSWVKPIDYVNKTKPTQDIQLITNPIENAIKEPIVFYALTQAMAQAKQEVYFHTPYIIGNDWMLDRLKDVCLKVPNVTMMTNSIVNNGNPFGAMDYARFKNKILQTGVHILEYDGGVSYHGKCMTIDHQFSAVGSFNWDMRSTYINTEMMVIVKSQELNQDLKAKMKTYEKDALKVKDEKTYELQDDQQPQEETLIRRIQIFFMQILIGWLRFLM